MTMRPALLPPMLMSKKTIGLVGLPAAGWARGTPAELLKATEGDSNAISERGRGVRAIKAAASVERCTTVSGDGSGVDRRLASV